jgi:hypothetical protein
MRNLFASENKEVAPFDVDAFSVAGRGTENPFRQATIFKDTVARAGPAYVRHCGPDLLECYPYICHARDATPEHLRPNRSFENNIFGHAGHDACAVMSIECLEKAREQRVPPGLKLGHTTSFLRTTKFVRDRLRCQSLMAQDASPDAMGLEPVQAKVCDQTFPASEPALAVLSRRDRQRRYLVQPIIRDWHFAQLQKMFSALTLG